jgi:hypothetical protein
MGFIKAFKITEVETLTIDIPKPIGLIWLLSCLLFFIYGFSYFLDNKYSCFIGLFSITISQILIILSWNDAKYGSIINILILMVIIIEIIKPFN